MVGRFYFCKESEVKTIVYIDIETVEKAAKLITALTVIFSALVAMVRWYLKVKNLSKKVEEIEKEKDAKIEQLREDHEEDIKRIEEEMCLHTYGILACLKGLQEKGCNGPVTDTITKFEKFINQRAHAHEVGGKNNDN